MKKHLLSFAIMVFTTAVAGATVLKASKIDMEKQNAWFTTPAADLSSAFQSDDSLQLLPSTHGTAITGTGPTSTQDASLTIRAFCSEKGLSLLVKVTDDTWSESDAVMLLFDTRSSQMILDGDFAGTYVLSSKYSITNTSMQVSVPCTPGTTQRYIKGYYSFTNYTDLTRDTLDCPASMVSLDSIWIKTISIDASHRIQQWFIPWKKFGTFGFYSVPEDGSTFAFSGGYNDYDGSADSAMLRVVKGTDPLMCKPTRDDSGCQPWEDIMAGDPVTVRKQPGAIDKKRTRSAAAALLNGRAAGSAAKRNIPVQKTLSR